MNTELVLSKDLVNPFIEFQKQKQEIENKQRALISGIHHHCYRRTDGNPLARGVEHFEVVAVDLVAFKLLIKSFNLKVETNVQKGSNIRMEYTLEEIDLETFLNSTNYEEISRENYYCTEVYYTSICDYYYDVRGFSFKSNCKFGPNWIW